MQNPEKPRNGGNALLLFVAVGHPTRVKILRALNDTPLRFAELKRALGIQSSAHLAFHLRKMEGLVRTVSERSYVLTDDGKEALSYVKKANLKSGMKSKKAVQGVRKPLRNRKKAHAALLMILMLSLGLVSLPISAEELGPWNAATSYPVAPVGGLSCFTDSGFIYCIHGAYPNRFDFPNSSFYSTLTETGVGTWNRNADPPSTLGDASCVASSGYVYCVGGRDGNSTDPQKSVYFASLTSSGIGTWTASTNYPLAIAGVSCVLSNGYIYCVGGNTPGVYKFSVGESVYYAQVSKTGVGNWVKTTNFPLATPGGGSCMTYSGYIYCVGGDKLVEVACPNTEYQPGVIPKCYDKRTTNAAFYAQLTSSGVGPWLETSSYPVPVVGHSCVAMLAYVYCVGGSYVDFAADKLVLLNSTYYAPIGSFGVGNWSSTSSYPLKGGSRACVASVVFLYCIGGWNPDAETYVDSVYFSKAIGLSSPSTESAPMSFLIPLGVAIGGAVVFGFSVLFARKRNDAVKASPG